MTNRDRFIATTARLITEALPFIATAAIGQRLMRETVEKILRTQADRFLLEVPEDKPCVTE